MRTLALVVSATLLGSSIAAAQQPGEDHLLSEDEYLNAPPNGQAPATPPQLGQGQPYTGQPLTPPSYDAEAAEEEDDVAVDDGVYELDDGWEAEAWTDFDQALSPYGTWVDSQEYGRVWEPSAAVVGEDFFPYASGGHWVLTEYGWTWVSDWGWGWAPFHYGRWISLAGYGWCWRPGRVWGPSWVAWRHGGGYVGWAPLGPRGVRIAPPRAIDGRWRFATAGELGSLHPRFLPSVAARSIAAHTAPVASFRDAGGRARFNAGPHPSLIAGATGRALAPTAVQGLPAAAPHSAIVPRFAPAARPGGGGWRPTVAPSPGWRAPAPVYVPRPYSPTPRANGPSYRYFTPSYATPSYGYRPTPVRPYRAAPSYGGPVYRTSPGYTAPAYRSNAPTYVAPSYRYNAPSYSAPHYSAPAYRSSAPSFSAPRYSAPAPHYSAPAPRYSAPAPHFSAPAARFGGGAHFGGGGAHFGGARR